VITPSNPHVGRGSLHLELHCGTVLTGQTFSVALHFDFAQIIVIPLIVAMANIRSEMRLIVQNKNGISVSCNIPHLGRRMHHPATAK
jgi:hypothetical protein